MDRKIIILLSVILLVIGLVLIMHSSYFEVKTIKVLGNDRLDVKEIVEASGIDKGQNIFLLPGREIANRLMNYVRIKGVKLERNFPDTLVIIINERVGVGLFPIEDGRWMELSPDGTMLEVYDENERMPVLPRIEGISPSIQGQKVKMTDNLIELLFFLKELYPLQSEITKVSYVIEDIRVILKSGTIIYFGHIADVRKNVSTFQMIWDNTQNPAKKLRYIDLRYAGKPVIREK